MVTSMLWSNFSFFSPFRNRSRSFLDRIEPSAKALAFHPDGNRYAIILFEGQPLRPRFLKNVSSSYLHLVWVKASDFSRSARAIQQIFSSTCSKDGRGWLQWIILSAFWTTYSIWLRTRKTLARQLLPPRRLLDFSRRSTISFLSDSWNSG